MAGLDPAIHGGFRIALKVIMDYLVSQHHPLTPFAGCCGPAMTSG
jgi:hypothetical protein